MLYRIFIASFLDIPEALMFVQSLITFLSDEKFRECFYFMTLNISWSSFETIDKIEPEVYLRWIRDRWLNWLGWPQLGRDIFLPMFPSSQARGWPLRHCEWGAEQQSWQLMQTTLISPGLVETVRKEERAKYFKVHRNIVKLSKKVYFPGKSSQSVHFVCK